MQEVLLAMKVIGLLLARVAVLLHALSMIAAMEMQGALCMMQENLVVMEVSGSPLARVAVLLHGLCMNLAM
jgi:hypothetical protein